VRSRKGTVPNEIVEADKRAHDGVRFFFDCRPTALHIVKRRCEEFDRESFYSYFLRLCVIFDDALLIADRANSIIACVGIHSDDPVGRVVKIEFLVSVDRFLQSLKIF
jgi:hypothetical protein